MTQHADNLFIVTGAPAGGKTTLLEAAAGAGLGIGQEAARAVIQSQAAIDGPAVQWRNPTMFAELMLDRDIQSWQSLRSASGPVLCDRGIPDLVAYGRMLGIADSQHYHRAATLYRYNPVVFFAPPWREIFATDAERIEGWEHAQRIYQPMRDVYEELGYRIVELPKVPVAERLAFVKDVIAHA
ncbi:AAA family ATPase [Devosia ginsengisoli]|uniref:AAA family ATPase n=1 Tax=Devosia ginsengisoli TaxID=400770 RepID=A0A5B8LRR0_9HYPH|nr:AAA family ATPase [Devosia ginsengisoli]QDZ10579.1 AAA family ATPase [Devosia ginsengisoli]